MAKLKKTKRFRNEICESWVFSLNVIHYTTCNRFELRLNNNNNKIDLYSALPHHHSQAQVAIQKNKPGLKSKALVVSPLSATTR